jgi:PEP-CTERM motif
MAMKMLNLLSRTNVRGLLSSALLGLIALPALAAVPLPATLPLLLMGLGALGSVARRRSSGA